MSIALKRSPIATALEKLMLAWEIGRLYLDVAEKFSVGPHFFLNRLDHNPVASPTFNFPTG
jgi:hypothetical protein